MLLFDGPLWMRLRPRLYATCCACVLKTLPLPGDPSSPRDRRRHCAGISILLVRLYDRALVMLLQIRTLVPRARHIPELHAIIIEVPVTKRDMFTAQRNRPAVPRGGLGTESRGF
jgi:hypothetical protein